MEAMPRGVQVRGAGIDHKRRRNRMASHLCRLKRKLVTVTLQEQRDHYVRLYEQMVRRCADLEREGDGLRGLVQQQQHQQQQQQQQQMQQQMQHLQPQQMQLLHQQQVLLERMRAAGLCSGNGGGAVPGPAL